jgi:cobalamin biosynthesis Mg chelatase CobN
MEVEAIRTTGSKTKERTTMPLTGKDVWEAIVKAGLLSGPYDPRTNRHCANADVLAGLLNEALSRRENWLPNLPKRARWSEAECNNAQHNYSRSSTEFRDVRFTSVFLSVKPARADRIGTYGMRCPG